MTLTAEGISLGPLLFRWGGLLIILGIAAGLLLAARESHLPWRAVPGKHRNYDVGIISDLFLPLIIWGTIGARLWHILTPPLSSVQLGLTTQYYLSHPIDMLALWIGGYGIPGALIGGIVAVFFFARANEYNFWQLADLLAPSLALAQAIGRLGNYFNQELYGLPTNLPWKIFIEPAYRLMGFETVETYHPLFAYEVILNFANMIFLLWLARRFANTLRTGDLFLAYLGIYSFVRLSLEFLRLDVALVNGININQAFFAIIFVCVGFGLVLKHRSAQKL
ncbi:MAG: prolipoprotein diacylglyceryl transferase [Anaerolineales bacterium]|nr:prolipoprotein diacylglyceryl transferase [Anaerolineales bacterium]